MPALGEPIWPSGKAGKRKDLGSIPLVVVTLSITSH